MEILRKLLLCTVLISTGVHAQECDTSTDAHRLNIEKSTIKYEQLNKKSGEYIASLKDGDLVMASFLQCGLGMNAHLYSHRVMTSSERAKILKWFLAAVLPTPAAYQALATQLDSVKEYKNNKTITVSGQGESHDFKFTASKSPLFKTALHYRWQPPEH